MQTEFEFINRLRTKHSLGKIGDDCAVLPLDENFDQIITADLLVEDIDFRLKWTTAELLGHKALAVSLSDIAAMGGQATSALLSIGLPESLWNDQFLDGFYRGWFTLANQFGVELIGGDISKTPDKCIIDSIVLGRVSKGSAIFRSGAKVGDRIYLTGSIGGAAAGLELLENGAISATLSPQQKSLLLRQLQPTPRLGLSKLLNESGLVTAMIDVSDGLSSDLSHLCQTVGARIYPEKIPLDPNIIQTAETFEKAVHGGEDFELIFTADEKKISTIEIAEITRIGEITANVGIIELISSNSTSILTPKGYRHF